MVWKITWGIWQIFIRALASLKIGTLMGFFCSKLKMYELKTYVKWTYASRQWRMIQKLKRNWLVSWHLEFDQFWFDYSKISKICTLIGCLWPKYIMFELKKYRGVMFDVTEYWCKIWMKTDLYFLKWHKEFGKVSFSPRSTRCSVKTLFTLEINEYNN